MEKKFSSFNNIRRFYDLCKAVEHCTLCPRLYQRKKIFSEQNGNPNSKVLFIAEAPGRLGADRTGVPLYGDVTGDNFDKLLGCIGWKREDVFITNAVLCNPREGNGNNDTPNAEEIKNCSFYLEMAIELINPEIIATLGRNALLSLRNISFHNRDLKNNVAQPFRWLGKKVFPLYHPAPRALMHRPFAAQRDDFVLLSKIIDPISGIKTLINDSVNYKQQSLEFGGKEGIEEEVYEKIDYLHELILLITSVMGKLTYFKLTKLLYLIDYESLKRYGQTLTGKIYLRQQEGPWPPDLRKAVSFMQDFEIYTKGFKRDFFVSAGPSRRFDISLDEKDLEWILDLIERYGGVSSSRLKTITYSTSPMKYLLRQEQRGRDMLNKPVLYKDKTAEELNGIEINS